MKEEKRKEPAPREFVPTELGSAAFVSVSGRPGDEDYLIENQKGKDDTNNGAGNPEKSGR